MPANLRVVCVGAGAHSVRQRWEATLLRHAFEYPHIVEALADTAGLVVACGNAFDILAALAELERSSLVRIIVACEHAPPAAISAFLDLGLGGWLAGAQGFEQLPAASERTPRTTRENWIP